MPSRWKRAFGTVVRLLIAALRFRQSNRPDPSKSPIEAGDPDDPHVEVALYQTAELTARNGRNPEQTVARYAAEALERAGFSATIHFGYEEKDPPIESSYDMDTLSWWADAPKEHIAQDANLLICDTKGGGRGGEIHQTTAGRYIDRLLPIVDEKEGRSFRHVRNNLHELGHALGGKHSDNMMSPPRMWYNDSAIDDFHENVQAVEESPTKKPDGK